MVTYSADWLAHLAGVSGLFPHGYSRPAHPKIISQQKRGLLIQTATLSKQATKCGKPSSRGAGVVVSAYGAQANPSAGQQRHLESYDSSGRLAHRPRRRQQFHLILPAPASPPDKHETRLGPITHMHNQAHAQQHNRRGARCTSASRLTIWATLGAAPNGVAVGRPAGQWGALKQWEMLSPMGPMWASPSPWWVGHSHKVGARPQHSRENWICFSLSV